MYDRKGATSQMNIRGFALWPSVSALFSLHASQISTMVEKAIEIIVRTILADTQIIESNNSHKPSSKASYKRLHEHLHNCAIKRRAVQQSLEQALSECNFFIHRPIEKKTRKGALLILSFRSTESAKNRSMI